MPPQELAFATPGAEEMTRIVTAGAGAGITGAVEGIVVKMAPQLGALEPVFTWGALLGVPAMAAAGALFTRGMIGDLFMGAACGGLGVVGYSLPAMLAPLTGQKGKGGGLTAEQLAALAASGKIKQLPAGLAGLSEAILKQQAAAKSGLEI